MPATATVAGGATVSRGGGSPQRRDRFSGLAAGLQRGVIRALPVKEPGFRCAASRLRWLWLARFSQPTVINNRKSRNSDPRD